MSPAGPRDVTTTEIRNIRRYFDDRISEQRRRWRTASAVGDGPEKSHGSEFSGHDVLTTP
jgi:hypothetical protein